VLLAPILKLWLLLKPLLFKTLPGFLLWIWAYTGAKVISAAGELLALLGGLFGGWKAWSAKKLGRQFGRFVLSLSARFVAVSVLLNMLFGHERRGVKLLPKFTMQQLHTTRLGRLLRWWSKSTERQKRLILGVLLCLVLILAGHALLGVSVLLFDLVWELLLVIWRITLRVWRILSPLLMKLVPNFIGNFVTRTVVPLIAEVVPIIRDDHRVLYLRFNIRRQLRCLKAWLYLKSRARRRSVRTRITRLVGDDLRAKKTALLAASASMAKGKDKKNRNNKNSTTT